MYIKFKKEGEVDILCRIKGLHLNYSHSKPPLLFVFHLLSLFHHPSEPVVGKKLPLRTINIIFHEIYTKTSLRLLIGYILPRRVIRSSAKS